jgi:hypothetical protein
MLLLRNVRLLLCTVGVCMSGLACVGGGDDDDTGEGEGEEGEEGEGEGEDCALDCPAHSRCDASSGTAECVCVAGYEGAACDACSYGYRVNASGDGCEVCADGDLDGHLPFDCGGPENVATDCDDADPRVPHAFSEGPRGDAICFDGLDNDCNGEIDAEGVECAPACTADGWCVVRDRPGQQMLDTIMFAPDDAWVVGQDFFGVDGTSLAMALHWDGTRFEEHTFPSNVYLETVYGVVPDDVWAAGFGLLLHWDGATWTDVSDTLPDSGGPNPLGISAMWGAAPDDVYAITDDIALLHWDGAAWTLLRQGNVESFSFLSSIDGCAPDDIWLSDGSTLYRYDGVDGTQGLMEWGQSNLEPFNGMGFSNGGTDTFVAAGGAWRFNGAAFERPIDDELPFDFRAIATSGPAATGTVWAAGDAGLLAQWDGARFVRVTDEAAESFNDWRFAFAAPTASEVLLGTRNGLVQKWDGVALTDVIDANFQTFNAVVLVPDAADPEGVNRIGFAAAGEEVFRTIGTAPNQFWSSDDRLDTDNVRGLWGSASDDVYAVGDDATIFHYDGSNWSQVLTGILPNTAGEAYRSVSGTSSTDVWVLGDSTVLHFDGAWELVPTPQGLGSTVAHIHAAAPDDVWVAWFATLLHYDGTSFQLLEQNTYATELFCEAPDDVWFIFGEGMQVRRYDGTRFTRNVDDFRFRGNSFGIVNENEVWFAGSLDTGEARIGRYNGATWSALELPERSRGLQSMSMLPTGAGIIGGGDGTVIVRNP